MERAPIADIFFGPDAESIDGKRTLARRIQVVGDLAALCKLRQPSRRGKTFNWKKEEKTTLSSQKAVFSTSKDDRPQKTPPSPGNPFHPAFSFEGLGANRTIKVAVIACLIVVGTIESMFWAKAIATRG